MEKLAKHLRVNNIAKANEASVIKGDKYRFTMLTNRLVRMEYSENGVFEDRVTQTVTNRDFPVPEFTVERENGRLIIRTEKMTVFYNENCPFDSSSLYVIPTANKDRGFSSSWHYADEKDYNDKQNLKGTYRTLDHADGNRYVSAPTSSKTGYSLLNEEQYKIEIENGVISRRGHSVIYDSTKAVITDDGFVEARPEGTVDIYFFGYGTDYTSAIKDFYKLTGNAPLLPKYVLGNWWSRYYKYTQQEYIELMERFEREDLPFSVAVIDMDWHIVDVPEKYGNGWTGYTWNKELFPDHKAFLKWLHKHNMHTSLNLHPATGVRAYEEIYPKMAEAMGIDPKTEQTVEFDASSRKFWNNYFKILHNPLEKEGVDFWWIDWQQGTTSTLKGIDPLWMLNHYHTLDIQRNGKRPLLFSRYSGPGSHRYPVGFSGDTVITWDSLDFQPYFTATASNIGYSWWSHDIGGHYHGSRDDELTTRWIQFGVFSPINRLHSSNNPFTRKEPWYFRSDCADTMKKFLRLRHTFIPYLYTMSYRNYSEAMPLTLPMYYSHPDKNEAYNVQNQYWFGSELIVAPITSKQDSVTLMGKVRVWLPEGTWTDFFTGRVYSGNRLIEMYRPLDGMPVFIKAGGIVPTAAYKPYDNTIDNPISMEIRVAAGADNSFTLYEDDGESTAYLDGKCAKTEMSLSWDKKAVFVINAPEGDASVLPAKRQWTVKFMGFAPDAKFTATAGGKSIDVKVAYDANTHTSAVTLPLCPTAERIEIVTDAMLCTNDDYLDTCQDILLRANCEFDIKNTVFAVLKKDIPVSQKIAHIASVDADKNLVGALTEILSAQ